MADRLLAAPHPQLHPADRRPQHMGLWHDERHRPPQTVAEHAGLGHGRVFGERPLHLRGWNLLSGGEDDPVGDPAGDPHLSVGGDLREVAGLEPAIGREGRVSIRRAARGHDPDRAARRPHEQLPAAFGPRVDPQLHALECRTDEPGPHRARIGERHHGARFGEAVALDERQPPLRE